MSSDSSEDGNFLDKIVRALTGGREMAAVTDNKSSQEKFNMNFCVETLAPTDIEVTVGGVGKLSFPLSQADVQKLINISTTASFEMGEETLVDKNVANTQMIEDKSLNVTFKPESLSLITNSMQKTLGLPAHDTLTPHLLNMLIDGPEQFFRIDRGCENLRNRVAWLVVILPSPHIGGDLIIEHGKKKYIFSSENIYEANAKCVYFYSDYRYNVIKVKCGYRIALTFSVVQKFGELANTTGANEELKTVLRDYFNTAAEKNRSKKIIFFLNHTYFEHRLAWQLLKGEDYQYASSFRAVAQELELDAHLALASIRQCWSSAKDYEAEPDSLIETENKLNFWVDANNVILSYGKYSATTDEICFTLETDYKNFDPTKEYFSGPTPSERSSAVDYWYKRGATVNYWYKRAAVVLWLKSDSIKIKFELNYDEAIIELQTLVNVPGNAEKINEILDKAFELLHADDPAVSDFAMFVNIALYIKEKKKAQAILSPFSLKVLILKNVQLVVQLQQKYGIDWLIELFDIWLQRERYYYYLVASLIFCEPIYPFVYEFLNSGGNRSVVEFLLRAEITSFIEKSAKSSTSFHFDRAIDNLEKPLELLKLCATIGSTILQEELAQYVTSQSKLFPKIELVKVYRQLQENSPENSENFEPFRTRLIEAVKQELSQTRQVDDWSISTVLSCRCERCNVLTNFLRSKTDIRKSWPATGNIRKHISSVLKHSKAPVVVTESQKKPFTIVLVKNNKLHVEAAEKCIELKKLLQSLEPKTALKEKKRSLKDDRKRQKL